MAANDVQELCDGIKIQKLGSVLTLIFCDTKTLNSVTLVWTRQLKAFAKSFVSNHLGQFDDVGSLVLCSTHPKVFMSGGDLTEIMNLSEEESWEFTSNMRFFCRFLSTCSVPTITLLSGGAYGGGAEVALATDHRLADFESTAGQVLGPPAIHLWQSKWGVPGGWGGMGRLEDLCPHLTRRAVSLLFIRAKSFDLSELKQLRLVEDFSAQGEQATTSGDSRLSRQVLPESVRCSPFVWHWILKLSEEFLSCPVSLRNDLLLRHNHFDSQRESFDKEIFLQHWRGKEHVARLTKFAQNRGK
jgi:enoyl-CoA hydratase/carnithine racemase